MYSFFSHQKTRTRRMLLLSPSLSAFSFIHFLLSTSITRCSSYFSSSFTIIISFNSFILSLVLCVSLCVCYTLCVCLLKKLKEKKTKTPKSVCTAITILYVLFCRPLYYCWCQFPCAQILDWKRINCKRQNYDEYGKEAKN